MVILLFHHSHFCTHGLITWLAVIYTPHKLQFWSILDIRYEFKCKDRYLMHMPPSGCSPAYWASGGLCFKIPAIPAVIPGFMYAQYGYHVTDCRHPASKFAISYRLLQFMLSWSASKNMMKWKRKQNGM
ncbi:hypothetical protein I7I48_07664 [Histoplasma ohiense]|nr:hypothetical protein I7I48_07664 [Histoplasma ohiense (nom. inval.)]